MPMHYFSLERFASKRRKPLPDPIAEIPSAISVRVSQRRIVLEQRLPDVLAMAMGDTIYLARFSTEEEMKAFIEFLTQEV